MPQEAKLADEICGTQVEFMQDHCGIDGVKPVKDWLQEKIKVLNGWPLHSPDLNPIENVWALLRLYLGKQKQCQTKECDRAFLWRKAQEWTRKFNVAQKQTIINLIDSFPRRLAECLKKEGGPTLH